MILVFCSGHRYKAGLRSYTVLCGRSVTDIHYTVLVGPTFRKQTQVLTNKTQTQVHIVGNRHRSLLLETNIGPYYWKQT